MRVAAKRGRWHVYTHDAITITADAYETILLGTAEAPSPQGQVCRSAQAACQQRLDELFPDMASRPESPEPPAKLTPEEIQQQLNEAFAGVLLNGGTPRTPPEPRIESPGRSLSSEELQQHLNEHFGNSRPRLGPTLSLRRIRSLFRAGNPATGGPSRRQRCDARVKNLFRIGKNGVGVAWPLLQRLGDGERSLLGAWRRVDGSEDQRARRASLPRWSRGGAGGLRDAVPRGGNSLRAASAARDGWPNRCASSPAPKRTGLREGGSPSTTR